MISKLDSCELQSKISAALNLANSTIRTILKYKEKIVSLATANASKSACSKNKIIEKMEKPLSIWILHEYEVERNEPVALTIHGV